MKEIILNISNTTRRALANDGAGKEMLMSAAGYIAAAITLIFIGFFGFFLNLCVIVLMLKNKKLWTPMNIILFNLVCSDFSVSILGTPWTIASALSYRWIFGKTMCKVYGFYMSLLESINLLLVSQLVFCVNVTNLVKRYDVISVSTLTIDKFEPKVKDALEHYETMPWCRGGNSMNSITTLTVLAFERYMIVTKPFRNNGLSRKNAIYLVAGIWIYSLILSSPPLIGWGKFVNEAANISCSVNWEEQTLNAMSFIMFMFAFGFFIPVAVILFSYAHIMITMKQSRIHMGQAMKAEGRVAVMVFLMILAFLLAWSPYAIAALLVQFWDPSIIPPAAGVIPALLAKSSICYNPIIYVGLNSQFRQALRQFLGMDDRNVESTCERYPMGVSKFGSTAVASFPVDGGRIVMHTPEKILQMEQVREKTRILEELECQSMDAV